MLVLSQDDQSYADSTDYECYQESLIPQTVYRDESEPDVQDSEHFELDSNIQTLREEE